MYIYIYIYVVRLQKINAKVEAVSETGHDRFLPRPTNDYPTPEITLAELLTAFLNKFLPLLIKYRHMNTFGLSSIPPRLLTFNTVWM